MMIKRFHILRLHAALWLYVTTGGAWALIRAATRLLQLWPRGPHVSLDCTCLALPRT